jgi:cell division protein FtsW
MNDGLYYLKAQTIWLILGIVVMFLMSFFDYHKLYYLSFPALIITLILLVVVLIPGVGVHINGARRWINLGFASLQPSEIAKFSIILYLSSWFLYKERDRFFSYLILMSIVVLLIMMQPDMGTTMIIFGIFLIIYFIAGLEIGKMLFVAPFLAGALWLFVSSSQYRMKRLVTYFNSDIDPLGIGYHVNQILISLSAGGIFGRGFGESRQKFLFLPEAHTDSIFAIISEEMGFVGGMVLVGLLMFLCFKCYQVAQSARDRFGQLLAGGIFSLIALEVTINLGAIVHIIPLTGVPLPFISYGGSNLLIFFSLMGILINIKKQGKA